LNICKVCYVTKYNVAIIEHNINIYISHNWITSKRWWGFAQAASLETEGTRGTECPENLVLWTCWM